MSATWTTATKLPTQFLVDIYSDRNKKASDKITINKTVVIFFRRRWAAVWNAIWIWNVPGA